MTINIDPILNGEVRAAARLMRDLDDRRPDAMEALKALFPHTGKAYVVGAYEHPLRKAPDKSVAQLHAEVAKGAIEDAGLTKNDIDGYFCAGDAPGQNAFSMANYLNLKLRHIDGTDSGGASYLVHVGHAAQAIALGKCNVALVTLAGRPTSEGSSGTQVRERGTYLPDAPYEIPYGPVTVKSRRCATLVMPGSLPICVSAML